MQQENKNPGNSAVVQMLKYPFAFRLYLLSRLPLAFIAGIKIESFEENSSEVSVPYRFLTKNPFQSVYFAALAMAAELSSGLQAMDAVQRSPVPISMLVLNMKAEFLKKARSRITFKSNGGLSIRKAIETALQTQEGQTVGVQTTGYDKQGEAVASFEFTWTFKPKQ